MTPDTQAPTPTETALAAAKAAYEAALSGTPSTRTIRCQWVENTAAALISAQEAALVAHEQAEAALREALDYCIYLNNTWVTGHKTLSFEEWRVANLPKEDGGLKCLTSISA